MSDLIGKTLGKYYVQALIGKGGMAEVYLTVHPGLSRLMAIKIIHNYRTDDEKFSDFVDRFEREVIATFNLRHENIVRVYDAGREQVPHSTDRTDDVYYMVMDYVEGPTLRHELDARRAKGQFFNLAEVAYIIGMLCSAMSHAHKQGVVHRDLKPSNIIINIDGKIVLTDFGIARLVNNTTSQYTNSGVILGTPNYMSPEQAKGERADERSDIYALGVILYELVTMRVPFEGSNYLAILHKHINNQPKSPIEINPEIPKKIEQIILKALAKNPDNRFQTVDELAQALAEATNKLGEQIQTIIPVATPPLLLKKEKIFDATQTDTPRQPFQRESTSIKVISRRAIEAAKNVILRTDRPLSDRLKALFNIEVLGFLVAILSLTAAFLTLAFIGFGIISPFLSSPPTLESLSEIINSSNISSIGLPVLIVLGLVILVAVRHTIFRAVLSIILKTFDSLKRLSESRERRPYQPQKRTTPPERDSGGVSEETPGGVTLIRVQREAVEAQDNLQHSVILKSEMERIFSAKNTHLIDDGLKQLNSEQLQKILSDESSVRLLLTGFERFGGTSLLRGVTAKLMKNFAAKSRNKKVLVIRLEKIRGLKGEYQLFINENQTAPVTNRLNETGLLREVHKALSHTANTINPQVDHEFNTFADQTSLFYRAEPKSGMMRIASKIRLLSSKFWPMQLKNLIARLGLLPKYSKQIQVIAALIRQTLNLLESDYNEVEIKEALEYLFHGDRYPQAGQIILILDRIDQPETMKRLLNSKLLDYRMQFSIIVVSRREHFHRWPGELYETLLKQHDFRVHYVRHLWESDFNLIKVLSWFWQIDLQAGDEEQQRILATWFSHLAYVARGSLARLLRHQKLKRNWSKVGQYTIMDIKTEYTHEKELIEHNARVQRILEENWEYIIDESLVSGPVMADQARLGVYQLIDWMRQNPYFTQAELETAAMKCTIPISNVKFVQDDVLKNLLHVLREYDYLEYLSDEGKYRLVWARPSPPSTLESLPLHEPPLLQPDQPLRIALLSDGVTGEESVNDLAVQLAFEILENNHQLVITDRSGIDSIIRQKLTSYWPLYTEDFKPNQEPMLVIPTNSDTQTDSDDQLHQLLSEANVVILTHHSEMTDSTFTHANLASKAKEHGVPVIPIGAVGGETATLWKKANNNLPVHFQRRITSEDFAKIGPTQTFIPDIARSAVDLAQKSM